MFRLRGRFWRKNSWIGKACPPSSRQEGEQEGLGLRSGFRQVEAHSGHSQAAEGGPHAMSGATRSSEGREEGVSVEGR